MEINLISIQGTAAQLQSLATSPFVDLDFHEESVSKLAPDLYQMGAYCHDSVIPLLEGRGMTVAVEMDGPTLDAHLAELRDNTTYDSGPGIS